MLDQVAPVTILSTMGWVYAAGALVFILFLLLVTPYFGVYGERDIDAEQPDDSYGDGDTPREVT